MVMFAEVPDASEGTGEGVPGQETGPAGGNFVEIVVWDVEEETFVLAAEFDETGKANIVPFMLIPMAAEYGWRLQKMKRAFDFFRWKWIRRGLAEGKAFR